MNPIRVKDAVGTKRTDSPLEGTGVLKEEGTGVRSTGVLKEKGTSPCPERVQSIVLFFSASDA